MNEDVLKPIDDFLSNRHISLPNIVMLDMKMLVALHSLLKFSHLSLEHDF